MKKVALYSGVFMMVSISTVFTPDVCFSEPASSSTISVKTDKNPEAEAWKSIAWMFWGALGAVGTVLVNKFIINDEKPKSDLDKLTEKVEQFLVESHQSKLGHQQISNKIDLLTEQLSHQEKMVSEKQTAILEKIQENAEEAKTGQISMAARLTVLEEKNSRLSNLIGQTVTYLQTQDPNCKIGTRHSD